MLVMFNVVMVVQSGYLGVYSFCLVICLYIVGIR